MVLAVRPEPFSFSSLHTTGGAGSSPRVAGVARSAGGASGFRSLRRKPVYCCGGAASMGFLWRRVAVGVAELLLLQPEVALLPSGLVKGLKQGLGRCLCKHKFLIANELQQAKIRLSRFILTIFRALYSPRPWVPNPFALYTHLPCHTETAKIQAFALYTHFRAVFRALCLPGVCPFALYTHLTDSLCVLLRPSE